MLYQLHKAVHIPRNSHDLLVAIEPVVRSDTRPIDLHRAGDITFVRIHPRTLLRRVIAYVTDEVAHHHWRPWASEAGCPADLHPLQWWPPHIQVGIEHIPPRMRLTGHDHPYTPPRALSA